MAACPTSGACGTGSRRVVVGASGALPLAPLTPYGREQARRAAPALRGIRTVHASTALRARQTAEQLGGTVVGGVVWGRRWRTRCAVRGELGRNAVALPAVARVDSGVPDLVAVLRAAGCVYAEDEARLLTAAAADPAELAALVARRVAGSPLEQVLGWAEFGGLRIAVEPGVFVPRRRTELLVEATAARRPRVLVELCCGSGAVSAVLAARLPGLEVHAADVDPAAVRCARRNLPSGHVYAGDLDAPLPPRLRHRVDVLVANAPYVPTAEIALMPPEARDSEPRVALDGGADGLDVARRVLAAAPRWLAPGGVVLIETSGRQAPELAAAAPAVGLFPQVVTDDELDATAVVAGLGRSPESPRVLT